MTKPDPETFCEKMDAWAALMKERDEQFGQAWRVVRLAISKSCLLSRTLYAGEGLSQTPCPVHKGTWSGLHIGWPDQTWSDGSAVEESPHLRELYDAGCRCFKHECGCTTGWNPDRFCGCGVAGAGSVDAHPVI